MLREQGDWFEDEIKFVRRLLAPNQKAIDIGANYGLFTLSMAKIVGPGGRIWASELNELVREGASETVTLISLDDATQAHGWSRLRVLPARARIGRAGVLAGQGCIVLADDVRAAPHARRVEERPAIP